MKREYVRLLEVEPRLGAGLSVGERARASRFVIAPTVTLPAGPWCDDELDRWLGDDLTLGLMVVDGLVAHELFLGGRVATHLLGRGDIVAPATTARGRLRVRRVLTAIDTARLALLDETFAAIARRWPAIAGGLLAQSARQTERVAAHQLISQLPSAEQRVVALLWHLADRWGREDGAGTVVPLTLTHEAISRLVGGRRATISGALSRLVERGLVVRLANGTWRVAPESRALLEGGRRPDPLTGIELLGPQRRARMPAASTA